MSKWLFILFIVIFAYFFLIAGNVGSQQIKQKIEQIDCQYPYRTTNPEGGCDNSDPCDPQDAVKGGSGQCKTAELKTTMSQNIKTVENTVESVGK